MNLYVDSFGGQYSNDSVKLSLGTQHVRVLRVVGALARLHVVSWLLAVVCLLEFHSIANVHTHSQSTVPGVELSVCGSSTRGGI